MCQLGVQPSTKKKSAIGANAHNRNRSAGRAERASRHTTTAARGSVHGRTKSHCSAVACKALPQCRPSAAWKRAVLCMRNETHSCVQFQEITGAHTSSEL